METLPAFRFKSAAQIEHLHRRAGAPEVASTGGRLYGLGFAGFPLQSGGGK